MGVIWCHSAAIKNTSLPGMAVASSLAGPVLAGLVFATYFRIAHAQNLEVQEYFLVVLLQWISIYFCHPVMRPFWSLQVPALHTNVKLARLLGSCRTGQTE